MLDLLACASLLLARAPGLSSDAQQIDNDVAACHRRLDVLQAADGALDKVDGAQITHEP